MAERARAALGILGALAVGCAGTGVRDEMEIGRRAAAQIRRDYPVATDPEIAGYVRELGARLVRAAGPQPYRYRFYVLEDPNPQAHSVAGGYVFVCTGALEKARSSADVAAILAHEIGHVVLRHPIETNDRRQVEAQRAAVKKATSVRANAVPKDPAQRLGKAFRDRGFSWEQELAADRYAVELLHDAGFCAGALSDLFAEWAADEDRGDPFFERFVATHPPFPHRIAEIAPAVESHGPCAPPEAGGVDPLAAVQQRLGGAE